MTKRVIGVMGASESDALTDAEKARLKQLAEKLGSAIAKHDCILISGATTGLPDLIEIRA
jgi:predicted Rossmann-fold nucleotide-binding protein